MDARDDIGFTPLHWAAGSDSSRDDLVQLLLTKGADPNAVGGDQVDAFLAQAQTPLMLAQKRGNTAIVAALKAKGAKAPPPLQSAAPPLRKIPANLSQAELRDATERADAILQATAAKSVVSFTRHANKQDCVSCHQQYLPMDAVGQAREKGVRVDVEAAQDPINLIFRLGRKAKDRFFETEYQHPANKYTLTTSDPITKAALVALARVWPGSLPLSRVLPAAYALLSQEPVMTSEAGQGASGGMRSSDGTHARTARIRRNWLRVRLSLPETANLLHLAPRTLRDWRDDFAIEMPPLHLLGRSTQRSARADRTAVLDVLKELGPATPLATLRECLPAMAGAELADLLNRYRRVWGKRYEAAPCTLLWRRVGAVWAMHFSEAPKAIDGHESYLFAVRDLASHQQLLWLPTPNLTADTSIAALRTLVTRHGAILVLKADNGSAFIAEAMRDFLSPLGVSLLFSPPYTPRYNGAIEAGIGSLKTRTERYASREDHPGYWTLDNVCAAQIEANATARPRGETGPTPDELWSTRRPPTPAERQQFQETVAHQRESWNEQDESSSKEERRMQREAIRRALVEHGILVFSRRRLPLPITTQKTAVIT